MAISNGFCKFFRLFAIMVAVANSSPATAQILQRLFGPADYEACMAENIIAATTPSAQRAVREDCNSRFPARHDGRGGYEYCRTIFPSNLNDTAAHPRTSGSLVCIPTARPTLSASDWEEFDRLAGEARQLLDQLQSYTSRISIEVYARCLQSLSSLGCTTARV